MADKMNKPPQTSHFVLHNTFFEETFFTKNLPFIISGPCSAESEAQVLETAKKIVEIGKVDVFRAGIWKPRTRPGPFEGVGETGLQWLQNVKKETGLPVATEIANAYHVDSCLKFGIDILWIGARTTANPFSVSEIAAALKGVDVPVMVKNPVNPDLQLWIGALERLNNVGITKIIAIHRGFSSFIKSPFRNAPNWEIPIELKAHIPELKIICDPSHIAGDRSLIGMVSQKALDLDMSGLMIECHNNPQQALSDSNQQVTAKELTAILNNLIVRRSTALHSKDSSILGILRNNIDDLDERLIQILASRMKISDKIGDYKRDNEVTIFQVNRWNEVKARRINEGVALGLPEEFVRTVLQIIHTESINRQNTIMNKNVS